MRHHTSDSETAAAASPPAPNHPAAPAPEPTPTVPAPPAIRARQLSAGKPVLDPGSICPDREQPLGAPGKSWLAAYGLLDGRR